MNKVSAERLKELLHYDPETGVFTYKKKCGCRARGSEAGTVSSFGYRYIMVDKVRISAQRLAWFYMTGEWPTAIVDHINRDRADNRFVNLREADKSQNAANAAGHVDSESGYKGVSRNNKGWIARITVRGNQACLGTYRTPEEAHAVYVAKAKELFGEFARAA